MTKIRIYQLSKELDLSTKDIIDELTELGIEVKNHMSAIEDLDALKIRKKHLHDAEKKEKVVETVKKSNQPETKATKDQVVLPKEKTHKNKPLPKKITPDKVNEDAIIPVEKIKKHPKKETENIVKDVRKGPRDYSKKTKKSRAYYKQLPKEESTSDNKSVILPNELTIGEFADLIDVQANDIIIKLMTEYNKMMAINASLDLEIAELLALEYGFEVEKEKTEVELNELEFEYDDNEKDLVFRAPVVTVMGHVDHGKTSLLDAIRKTSVTKGEAGGITQHIGASEVYINNKKIVFLDTPGHEAFTTLRARGAKVTDIAVLVVAADDGVMPQTIEAIDHAKAAGVPIIVAINKIDKDNANPDRVKKELADHDLLVEDWGGDIISVELSALKGEGIDTLLEMILLVAEIEELKANPKRPAIGTVIEANLDKGRGPVATVLVQNGTLKIGDPIFVGRTYGKVRAMFNDKGKNVKSAKPSTSVEVLGLNEVPVAGEKFYVTTEDKRARLHAERNINIGKEQAMRSNKKGVTLEELFEQIKDGEIKELNIVLKADVHGSMEAIKQSLAKLSNEEVRVNIIHSQIGAITESDVLLASASKAIIIGFNVRPSTNVASLADIEKVELRTYRIIYEAIKDVKDALSGLLEPEYREMIEGKIEVRTTFKVPNIGTIAGAYVLEGKASRNSKVRLIREGIVIFEGKISSLKRFKDDVKEVNTGYECGIGLENFNDLKEGDIIETFYIKEIERTLD
ncbi:MAG: translation initiation factor IF-2 [Clostridiales bacterium]|nr:translation initiation factor IF-2 [Clostridiales bacterium]